MLLSKLWLLTWIVTLQLSQTSKKMASIKLLVLCVAMVVVCLELQQGQAQGDVIKLHDQPLAVYLWWTIWGKPAYFMPDTIIKWKLGLASKLIHLNNLTWAIITYSCWQNALSSYKRDLGHYLQQTESYHACQIYISALRRCSYFSCPS